MKKEILAATIKTLPETIRGARMARELAGRKVIEQIETACFAIYFAYKTGVKPSYTSIALASRTQDWMERFNRLGDENSRDSTVIEPFWQRHHIVEELAGLQTEIISSVRRKYPGHDGQERSDAIIIAFEDYIDTTCIVEDWMTGKKQTSDLSPTEKQKLGALPEAVGENIAKLYRIQNDTPWLKVLMMILSDGNEKVAENSLSSLLSGVMLFQIADDYAFTTRNKKVGKVALFVDGEQSLRKLEEAAAEYFDGLELPFWLTSMIKAAWYARCIIGKSRMSSRKDTRYSNDDLFDRTNTFEERINQNMFMSGR